MGLAPEAGDIFAGKSERVYLCRCLKSSDRLFLLAAGLGAQRSPVVAPPPASPSEITIIIDATAFDARPVGDTARGQLVQALALREEDPSKWLLYRATRNESLTTLIDSIYGYNSNHPYTRDILSELVTWANPDIEITLRVGQSIRLPVVPRRAFSRGAESELAQLIGWSSDTVTLVNVSDILAPDTSAAGSGELAPDVVAKRLGAGASWIVTGSASNVKTVTFIELVRRLTADSKIQREVYIGAPQEFGTLSLPMVAHLTDSVPPPYRPTPQATAAARQGADGAKRAYLLDFFNADATLPCPHGALVNEVAGEVLRTLGVGQLMSSVRTVNLDFYADVDSSRRLVKHYIERNFSRRAQMNLLVALETLARLPRPGPGETRTPLLFLQAIYGNLLDDPRTGVISSSFYVGRDAFRIAPAQYTHRSNVVLVSAVLDDDDSSVEETDREPIKSFYDLRAGYGYVLVGGETKPGLYFGMRSTRGDGVTVIGKGAGWGSLPGACITPQLRGTSFAAPSVAAAMLLAQNYWASKGMAISGVEAKTRLMLSSEVLPQYVGKFASAGEPRLERLLRPNGVHVVKSDGSVSRLDTISGSVTFRLPGSSGPTTLQLGSGDFEIRGIAIDPTRAFVFISMDRMWEQVTISSLSITVLENGILANLDLSTFRTRYREVLLFFPVSE